MNKGKLALKIKKLNERLNKLEITQIQNTDLHFEYMETLNTSKIYINRNFMSAEIKELKIPREKKLEYWGEGPWVDEDDYCESIFTKNGFRIPFKIVRICVTEHDLYFGGYWCGYVQLPDHPIFLGKKFDGGDVDFDVHGGITWDSVLENKERWIGFDCAHSGDVIPSFNVMPFVGEIEHKMKIPEHSKDLFCVRYKTQSFALGETINLATQVADMLKDEKI